jgi:pimeloyl-ACP methyl ester carboxylesterase
MQITIDGRTAYAYTGGKPFDPGLPAVAFVHGAQNDHSVWILQSRYFAHHGFAVLAWDLPGHGRSAGPALDTVEAMADWVLRASLAAGAQARGDRRSQHGVADRGRGGRRRQPAQVSAIALVGTAYPMKVSDALLQAARDDEPRAFDMINQWSFSGVTHRPGNPGPGIQRVQRGPAPDGTPAGGRAAQ